MYIKDKTDVDINYFLQNVKTNALFNSLLVSRLVIIQ